jgi:hypothetical protein
MIPEWLIGAFVSLGVYIILGIFAYSRFRGTDQQWKSDFSERQAAIEKDVKSVAVLAEQVRRLDRDYHLMHEWKRTMLPMELDHRATTHREYMDRIERDLRREIERCLRGNDPQRDT